MADEKENRSNRALREAGYRRAQRVWLTQEQYEMLMYMAHQNEADIIRIRDRAHGRR